MSKEKINIGILSKGRLKEQSEKILAKKKLKIFFDQGERELIGRVKNRPDILKDLHDFYIEHSLEDLENACKKFIDNDELDKAWTIVSIIEEK